MNNLTWGKILHEAERIGETSFMDNSINTDSAPLFMIMLSSLTSRGWKLPNQRAIRLPKIILSDEIVKINGINGEEINDEQFWGHIELMGVYRQNPAFNDWNHEGEIVIYFEKIRQVAERYDASKSDKMIFITNDMKSSSNSTFQKLLEIVMAHEITHWIMHWFTSPSWLDTTTDIHGFIPFKYETDSQVEFHESVAQLFTWFSIKQWHDMSEIFNWLMTGQPIEYSLWNDLVNKGVSNIEHAVKLMEAFRAAQCQEYTTLDSLADWEDYHFYPFFSELSRKTSLQQLTVIKNRIAAYVWLVDKDEVKISELLSKVKMEYSRLLVDDGEIDISQLLTKLKIEHGNLLKEEFTVPQFLRLAKLGVIPPGCKIS